MLTENEVLDLVTGPAGTRVGLHFAELEIGGDVSGPHVKSFTIVEFQINGPRAGRNLNDADLASVGFIEPKFHEVPGFRPDHRVEDLGEMIFESVRVLALERFIVVLQSQRFFGIVHPDHQMAALGVQKSGDGFHRGLFQFAVQLVHPLVKTERRFEFNLFVLVLGDEPPDVRFFQEPIGVRVHAFIDRLQVILGTRDVREDHRAVMVLKPDGPIVEPFTDWAE